MRKTIGLALMSLGVCCGLTAGALAVTCTPQPVQSPARCIAGGESKLEENPNFPNCMLDPNGPDCIAAPGTVCGQFNGFGQPRHGECRYHLSGSLVPKCQEQTSEIEITVHYWVGGCGWDQQSMCACVFEESQNQDPATTTVCDCTQVYP